MNNHIKYKVVVPITRYEQIHITPENVASALEAEIKRILGKWDWIYFRKDGTGYYYKSGYGSHNIGEEYGPEVDAETIKKFKVLKEALEYFNSLIYGKE